MTDNITGQGRVLARNADVTFIHDTVNVPTSCVSQASRDAEAAADAKAAADKAAAAAKVANLKAAKQSIELRSGDVGAPFALALSARSNVLQEFAGGPGQIALHGLTNVGGVLGTAASHGCIRLANATMQWLALRIGPGVPATIRN